MMIVFICAFTSLMKYFLSLQGEWVHLGVSPLLKVFPFHANNGPFLRTSLIWNFCCSLIEYFTIFCGLFFYWMMYLCIGIIHFILDYFLNLCPQSRAKCTLILPTQSCVLSFGRLSIDRRLEWSVRRGTSSLDMEGECTMFFIVLDTCAFVFGSIIYEITRAHLYTFFNFIGCLNSVDKLSNFHGLRESGEFRVWAEFILKFLSFQSSFQKFIAELWEHRILLLDMDIRGFFWLFVLHFKCSIALTICTQLNKTDKLTNSLIWGEQDLPLRLHHQCRSSVGPVAFPGARTFRPHTTKLSRFLVCTRHRIIPIVKMMVITLVLVTTCSGLWHSLGLQPFSSHVSVFSSYIWYTRWGVLLKKSMLRL